MPPGVVTVMSTVPADSAGENAVQEVAETQLNTLAVVNPNSAVVEPTMKPVPVTPTVVPPTRDPADGLTEVIVGIASKVNWSAEEMADAPPGVVTVRSTVPAASEGDVTVHDVVEAQLTVDPVLEPNFALVTPAPATKPVPVTVTVVPPASGPTFGLMELTAGMTS